MNLDEVKARLIGKTIKEVRATEWDDDSTWLSDFGSVEIVLDNGTILDSLGEPVQILFPEADRAKK